MLQSGAFKNRFFVVICVTTPTQKSNPQLRNICLASLATIVLIRLISLSFPDLVDSTEGRYASIAKLMLDRNDWITPWINFQGVEQPYNGKPPLHFWLMQLSYLAFGFGAFSARLPGVLSAIGTCLVVGLGARRCFGATAGYLAALVFASSTITFFLSGAAVLDMTLTFGTSLATIGFLLADRSRLWGYLCFAGAGLGVLVKGPLAIVLPGLVVVPWLLIRRYNSGVWPSQFKRLPWISGTGLFLAIAGPWYALAEIKTPGFLEYFFINENFGRYLKKDYGDVYGVGHRQPFGAAWLMMFPALVPWSFVLLWWGLVAIAPVARRNQKVTAAWVTALLLSVLILVLRRVTPWTPHVLVFFPIVAAITALFYLRGTIRSAFSSIAPDPELLFAFFWAVSCPLLLTTARQYTGTYILPSIPGFAFLAAAFWAHRVAPSPTLDAFLLKTIRAVVFLFGFVVMIGSSIGAVRYGTPLWLTAVCFAIGAVFMLSLQVNRADSWLIKEVCRLSVCCAMTFALASFCWDNSLSNNRSTRRLLQVVGSLGKPGFPLRVGFPLYFPFSATFYGPLAEDPKLMVVHVDEDKIPIADVDVLVVRDRNETAFLKAVPNKAGEKLSEIGQWNIYRGTGVNLK